MANRDPYIAAASALAAAVREGRYRSVVVSGLTHGEGISTTALEVATAVQNNFGLSPVLLEWNRVRPVLHKWLNLDPSRTLSALHGGGDAADMVQTTPERLHVLPFGESLPGMSVNGFHPVLSRAILELESKYPLVVIDTPPLLASGDALAAAMLVRQLILVVQSGKSSYDEINRMRQRLESDGVSIVGAVMTERKRALPRWLEAILGN